MKVVNLKSLLEVYDKNGSTNIPKEYLNYLSCKNYELEIKDNELTPLKSLIETLEATDSNLTLEKFNSFYIGYKIPQIGKEFDLLRINKLSVLNIEYKREIKDINKVQKQSLRNKYYLKFLERKLHLFTYIEKENVIYKLNKNNELIQSDYQDLVEVIKNQNNDEKFYEGNLNELFEPSNYLISPFRKTTEFINGKYFLTQEQEEIEKTLINETENGVKYFFITGEAGSGKTLLTYHFAKKYIEAGDKIGIIHCGKLNTGHKTLKKEFKWNIQPMKCWEQLFSEQYPSVIIIDEIQRINDEQFSEQFSEMFNNYIYINNIILIMSGDRKQTLGNREGEIIDILTKNQDKIKILKLNSKIRTNKELSSFIKIMLDLNKKLTLKASSQNIDIVYFSKIEDANNYISTKSNHSYISYTPSLYYDNEYADIASLNPRKIGNSHEVVGQEFENVIVVLGEHFYYDGNILKARDMTGIPYVTLQMFFQQITRAINKLEIVVVDNIDVFNKLIKIFE